MRKKVNKIVFFVLNITVGLQYNVKEILDYIDNIRYIVYNMEYVRKRRANENSLQTR